MLFGISRKIKDEEVKKITGSREDAELQKEAEAFNAAKRKKNKRIARLIRLICVTGLLAVILILLLVFKVNNIIVIGNDRYSDEQIKSLVINENSFNNSILFCLFNKTVEIKDVPLLASIDVAYVNRNTIQLTANEKVTIGMYPVADKYCCIDQDGIVIEIIESEDIADLNLPVIYNLCSSGTVGEKINIEDDSVLNTLHAFMSSFKRYSIMPEGIFIEDEPVNGIGDNIIKTYTLYFGDVRVLAGPDEYLEEKMRRVSAILPHLEGLSGTLHLETYNESTENIIFDTTDIIETDTEDLITEETAKNELY